MVIQAIRGRPRPQNGGEIRDGASWLVGSVIVGTAVGLLIVVAPIVPVLAITAAGVTVVSQRRPDVPLAFGGFATLVSGIFGIVEVASFVLVVGGGVVGIRTLAEGRARDARILALPLIVLSWFALRLTMESSGEYARALVACLGAVLLAGFCCIRQQEWVSAFTMAGVAFVAASFFFGMDDPTGLRFQGISGNPNRMVFGLLVALPAMFAYWLQGKLFSYRILILVPVGMAISMVLESGSSQGVVGLALLVVCALVYLARSARGGRAVVLNLFAVAVLVIVTGAGVLSDLGEDTTSLSGRTSTYQAGYEEFRSAPIVGTGELRVSSGLVVDRATHSSTVSLAASSGIVGVLGWVLILLRTSLGSVRGLRSGSVAAAIGLVVVTSQIVQTIELLPIAWAAIVLVSGSRRSNSVQPSELTNFASTSTPR